jgi:hypothetical protein
MGGVGVGVPPSPAPPMGGAGEGGTPIFVLVEQVTSKTAAAPETIAAR